MNGSGDGEKLWTDEKTKKPEGYGSLTGDSVLLGVKVKFTGKGGVRFNTSSTSADKESNSCSIHDHTQFKNLLSV